jgi:hypothetical protein
VVAAAAWALAWAAAEAVGWLFLRSGRLLREDMVLLMRTSSLLPEMLVL